MKEYWNALIQKGLLIYDANIERFRPTEEGRSFLKVYKEMDYDVIKATTTTKDSNNQSCYYKKHLELKVKTLKNAPRNVGKLDELSIKIEKQSEEDDTTKLI